MIKESPRHLSPFLLQYCRILIKSFLFVIIVVVCLSCSVGKRQPFNPATKYSPEQLSYDFDLLNKILDANHPSLYWYASPDSVGAHFTAVRNSLLDSLSEGEFKNKVSWAIKSIHCGHTSVRSSKEYSNYYSKRRISMFPLSLKVWGDTAVVVSVLTDGKDSAKTIKRGSIIIGINDHSIKVIIDSMCTLIGTDGYANNFKYQLISFNFPAYYKSAFGTDSSYLVKYLGSDGRINEVRLKNFGIKADTVINRIPPEGLRKRELRKIKLLSNRNLRIDSALNTAFMSLNTFSNGRLNRFFKKSFKTIKHRNIKNLVVDLRLNSGGSVLASTKFIRYLAQKPFLVADTVVAIARKFPFRQYIKPWFVYWLSMHISGRRYRDGKIHFRYFEKHLFKPDIKNHFDGNIYMVTGGYTFSAGSMVVSKLKGQSNVTIVGEETGGGAYGNSAMFLPVIELPNTKLRVTLPLYRMVFDRTLPKNGRGVMPDIEIRPTSNDIEAGVDAKISKVIDLINSRTKP